VRYYTVRIKKLLFPLPGSYLGSYDLSVKNRIKSKKKRPFKICFFMTKPFFLKIIPKIFGNIKIIEYLCTAFKYNAWQIQKRA